MIRKGTLEDIPQLVEMGRKFMDETRFRHAEYSVERVTAAFSLLVTNGFIVVYERNGKIVGGMMGDVIKPWYSNDLMGFDHGLYVYPEFRNGMIAIKLIKSFEDWCVSMGAKQIRPAVTSGNPSVLALYEKLGYECVGKQFLKDT